MNAEQLETEALKLEPDVRAKLAERLFLSLDPITSEEWDMAWSVEVERRNAQMAADPALGILAEEVFRKAFSKVK